MGYVVQLRLIMVAGRAAGHLSLKLTGLHASGLGNLGLAEGWLCGVPTVVVSRLITVGQWDSDK